MFSTFSHVIQRLCLRPYFFWL